MPAPTPLQPTAGAPATMWGVDGSGNSVPVVVDANGLMQSVLSSLLGKVFGTPQLTNTSNLSFTSADDSIDLDASSVYLLIATEACHVSVTVDSGAAATTSALLLPADQYLAIQTTATLTELHAIRHDTDGVLYACKMGAAP